MLVGIDWWIGKNSNLIGENGSYSISSTLLFGDPNFPKFLFGPFEF